MKIPKKEVVKFVVKSVLHKHIADSQAELTKLVDRELKKVDPEYAISGKRLRETVVSMPEVRVQVDTKKGGVPARCPVCDASLKKAWNRNLKGKKVLEQRKCQKCGYSGREGKWLPRKYKFWVVKKH